MSSSLVLSILVSPKCKLSISISCPILTAFPIGQKHANNRHLVAVGKANENFFGKQPG